MGAPLTPSKRHLVLLAPGIYPCYFHNGLSKPETRDRGFDEAVFITDGYASMTDELRQQLGGRQLVTLTILFGGNQDCEDFAQFGWVVQLEYVCN